MAKASGRTVELAVQRALAELDFAPGELADDQYEVTIVIPPEEGFMGVGAVDAVVEVALVGDEFDFYGPEDDSQPEELLDHGVDGAYDGDDEYEEGERPGYAGDYDDEDLDEGPEAVRLRAFLKRVLTEMGLAARIRITEGAEELHAEITGDDLGILIGRRGQTIDAVEYLAGIAVFPGAHPRRRRVDLDAEGYKDRRRRQVERVAVRKADEAARRGRPVQLAPMTPAERKIVHLTLRGRKDVATASEGREPNRSVVISPVR
ncbi:MAG: KH domain-containing protein [Actinobacteria bacterium]|nr:KH domain-containing protein [Actinomycetota bacterium]